MGCPRQLKTHGGAFCLPFLGEMQGWGLVCGAQHTGSLEGLRLRLEMLLRAEGLVRDVSHFSSLAGGIETQIIAFRSAGLSTSETDNCTTLGVERSGDKKQFPAGEYRGLGCI